MANPPSFTIPAYTPKSKKTKLSAWQTWLSTHPGWKTYAPLIETWAESANVDRLGFAIALSRKYGANPTNLTDRTFNTDSAGLASYVNALGWDAGYRAWSNNPNVTITKLTPKGYVFKGTQTPASAATETAARAEAAIPTTNPYVYIDAHGMVQKWAGTTPPVFAQAPGKPAGRRGGGAKGTTQAPARGGTPLTYFDQPVTLAQWLQLKKGYDELFLAYAGRPVTPRELQVILANGTTEFQLKMNLAKQDSFTRSPLWKQNAPSYIAIARRIYGPNWKPNDPAVRDLLRSAIVNTIGGDAFADQLRQLPGYVNTAEFKTNAAGFSTVYQHIYGQNDPNEPTIVHEATLAGWSPEQFTNYLRSLPQYTASGEYLYKATAFADALGLITGQQTKLQPGQLPPPNPAKPEVLPNSPNIPGDPNKTPPQTVPYGVPHA